MNLYNIITKIIFLILFYSLIKVDSKLGSKISIPIAFAINNLFTYPLIVLLTSILYNSKPNTFFFFM